MSPLSAAGVQRHDWMKNSRCFTFVLYSIVGISQALFGSSISAQDRVTFTPDGTASAVTAMGEVIDYTGRQLVLRTLNGSQQIPSANIISVETNYSPAYLRAIQEFDQAATEAAQSSFREALKLEPRSWVQREIRSWLVKCSLRQQDLSGALREFREIALTDPQTRHWGIAPLIWIPMAISPALKTEIQPWLKSEREAERMLSASLLLLDPVLGEAAEGQLNLLARDPNPVLAAYGKAQLWRLTIASQKVNELTLENWRGEIARMRPELRNGPQYLLSRGYDLRGELRLAATEALWVPYVYSENETVSARALFDAGTLLAKAGLETESQTVSQELMVRYSWSREASMMRAERKQSTAP